MARGCAHPSGVIQRTVGATLYLDGGGAGAGAVSSRVHAPAPRWDSAPLAKSITRRRPRTARAVFNNVGMRPSYTTD
jgi:hypothetical protein